MTTQTQDLENSQKATQTAGLLMDDLRSLHKSNNQVLSTYAYDLLLEAVELKKKLDRLEHAVKLQAEQ